MSHAKPLHHRCSLNDYLELINREGLPGNLKSALCLKVPDTVLAPGQHIIAAALDEARRASRGLGRYEHRPWGRRPGATRRGSYQRAVLMQYGPMIPLHVPQRRLGNGALTWHSLPRYERCWEPLLDHQVMS